MPYVTDGSKAVQRITEIERELQEARAELERWLAAGCTPTGASELALREREGKALTDRLQAVATALEVQRPLASPALHEQELKEFMAEVERVCRGKRGKGWSRERDCLLRNARAGRLNHAKARRAKMPIGSGTMESAIRRVVNLRLKGAGIFWHEEHAEEMLLLRTYSKSKRKPSSNPSAQRFFPRRGGVR